MARSAVVVIGIIGGLLSWQSPARAMGFCGLARPTTLRDDAAQAAVIVYGTIANPRWNDEKNEEAGGVSDLRIHGVLKSDRSLRKQKVLQLHHYVPVKDPKNPPRLIVFFDVSGGQLDASRAIPVDSGSFVEYLSGALALDQKDQRRALCYFLKHLENRDEAVARDAFLEVSRVDYKDLRAIRKHFSPQRIVKWLKNPRTPETRLGLYAMLLGECGDENHANFLRKLLDGQRLWPSPTIQGFLCGYTMLRPKEGWEYVSGILKNSKRAFEFRYAALGSVRFFRDKRNGVVDEKELMEGICLLLDDHDLADLAIEDLRKWRHWEVCHRVLELFDRESHDIPIVRRSIVRYALSCPSMLASRFAAEQRRKDAEWVQDIEDLLELEKKERP